tara:strand:+ start:419 stop:667 length:249 start_codon:yes stop_codon:yes gene_type:complete
MVVIFIAYNELNKDSMNKKEQIEQLYTEALYNDEAPNVFADRILSLFGVSSMFVCGDLIKHNFSISKIGRCIPCDRLKEKAN